MHKPKLKTMAMDIEAIAQAIEADAGRALPGLRESLQQTKAGKCGRIHKPGQILVRAARGKLGLSQSAFAGLIQTPIATVQDWEQGRSAPPGGVQCLLRIALKHPDIVLNLAA